MAMIAAQPGVGATPGSTKIAAPKPARTVGGPNPGGLASPQNYGVGTSITASKPGGSGGGGSIAPPLDGTALANIAAYLNKTGNAISNDELKGATERDAYQNTINQLNQQQPLSDLKILSGANAHGQGVLGSGYIQQVGNENTLYANKAAAAANTLNGNLGALQNAIAQLQASEPIYQSQEAAASTARASASAAKLAPASTLVRKAAGAKGGSRGGSRGAPVVGGPNPGGLASPQNRPIRGIAPSRQLRPTPLGGVR